MGTRIKFQMVQTTQAFVIATNRMDEPIVASFAANWLLLRVAAAHAINSRPARDVINNQDHPVNEMGKALILPNDIFAWITTIMPQAKTNESMAVSRGIPSMALLVFSSTSWSRTNGENSNGLGLNAIIAV